MAQRGRQASNGFAGNYPHLARRVTGQGWIEIGSVGFSRSSIRVLDEGELVWEGGDADRTVEDARREANAAVERWERGDLTPP
jgi:hypothetical protein